MDSPIQVNDAFGVFQDAKDVVDALRDGHKSGNESTTGPGWWEVINASLDRVSEMLGQGLTEMSTPYDDLEYTEG